MSNVLPAILGAAGLASVGTGMLDAANQKKAREEEFNTAILRAGLQNRILAGDTSVFDNPDFGKAFPKQMLDPLKAITQAIAQGKVKDQAAMLDMARKFGFMPEPGAQPPAAPPPQAGVFQRPGGQSAEQYRTPGAASSPVAGAPPQSSGAPAPQTPQIALPPDSVWAPLQPERKMTIDAQGKASFTLSQPSNEAVMAHADRQANGLFAAAWVQNNPEVAARFPGLSEGIRNGSPAAINLVQNLIKERGFKPTDDQLKRLFTIEDPRARNLYALQIYGGDNKAALGAVSLVPSNPGVYIKDLDAKWKAEAGTLAAEKGLDPSKGVPPELVRQAQRTVLEREKKRRDESFGQTFAKQKSLLEEKASLSSIASEIKEGSKKIGQAQDALDRAVTAGNQLYTAFRLLRGGMLGNTDFRLLDVPLRATLGLIQSGQTGQAVAQIKGMRLEYAQLEQQLFQLSSRPGQKISLAIEETLPDWKDKASVQDKKFVRMFQVQQNARNAIEKHRAEQLRILRSRPEFKAAADAFEQRHYDQSQSLLEGIAGANAPTTVPIVNYDLGSDVKESQ